MVCGPSCVDTWTDPANCGRCTTRCGASQRCELGACVATDPCAGLSCPTCQLCRAGRCEPITELTACGAGRECVSGACVATCATNYCQTSRYDTGAWCDGRAVVTCATAGRCRVEASRVACPTDCVAGRCEPCPANFADCDGVAANGCEADLRASASHCGSCGGQCAGGMACRGGVCDGSAVRLALGALHSCALTTLGTAQCWGDNVDGALGNGAVFPLRDELTPVGVLDLRDATDLAAGQFVSCAVRTGGAAVCWGNNGQGQLGTGATSPPVSHFGDVLGLRNARQVTIGDVHACAATTADTAVCWGLNLDGRLGDGTTTARLSPVAVVGLTSVARVEAGAFHTCALRRDGTVACWGFGTMGRLGNGSTADQTRPVAMTGVTGATAVACAGRATCVLRGDGTVACTGGNERGELGDGGTANRTTVAAVPGLTEVVRLAAGASHLCAVRRDGSVWCWGRNDDGQLGDGTTTERRVPTRVPGLADVVEVDAGAAHTCALRAGGRIVCWGANAEGQLGDGTTTRRATPTAVVLR